MERYLEIAGFAGEAQYAVRQVLGGRVLNLRIPQRHIYDSLAEALCWQCYNLFEGPLGQYRPVHSPDPTNIMQEFGHLGADTFDFPVVGPPHGFRANTLYRAYQQMTAYINAGSGGSPQPCLDLLEQISHLGVIRACDVNWFAIEKARFLALTPMQRRRFFDAWLSRRPLASDRPTDQSGLCAGDCELIGLCLVNSRRNTPDWLSWPEPPSSQGLPPCSIVVASSMFICRHLGRCFGTLTQSARAIQPIARNGQPKFKFSLAAYSYRDLLLPKQGKEPQLTLKDFIDDCAKLGLEGTELTQLLLSQGADGRLSARPARSTAFGWGSMFRARRSATSSAIPRGEKRDAEIAKTKQWIDYAEMLGAPVIRIFAGHQQKGQTEPKRPTR